MNLHQVLTGAVNPGDHCFAVGSVGEQRFTVSAGGAARPPLQAARFGALKTNKQKKKIKEKKMLD